MSILVWVCRIWVVYFSQYQERSRRQLLISLYKSAVCLVSLFSYSTLSTYFLLEGKKYLLKMCENPWSSKQTKWRCGAQTSTELVTIFSVTSPPLQSNQYTFMWTRNGKPKWLVLLCVYPMYSICNMVLIVLNKMHLFDFGRREILYQEFMTYQWHILSVWREK